MKKVLKLFSAILLVLTCVAVFGTTDTYAKTKHTVTFMWGANVSVQTVTDGGNAKIPTNVEAPGFTFLGWTDSAVNVRTDKIIIGMYAANTPYAQGTNAVSNVKKVNNNTSAAFMPWWTEEKGVPGKTCVVRWYNGWNKGLYKTEVVPFGTTLPDPVDPQEEGLMFVGWEGSWQNITEDRAIAAYFYRVHKVSFYDSLTGAKYDLQYLLDGDDAYSCLNPVHEGYEFDHYEGKREDIHEDTDLYAIYREK